MIDIILATGNAGKAKDFQAIFDARTQEVTVHTMHAFGGMPEVDESEPDFKGNAKLKAQAVETYLRGQSNKYWILADDSGLEVDALDGAPGIHSARYSGANATDESNRNKLLQAIVSVEDPARTARFVSSLALISPEGQYASFEGYCCGRILKDASGSHGFGYDSLFAPKDCSESWGEMDPDLKNAMSHRYQATNALISWLVAKGLI